MYDAYAFAETMRALNDAYANLRTPWRPQEENGGRSHTHGSRPPVACSVLDMEQTIKRSVMVLYTDTVAAYPDTRYTPTIAAPPPPMAIGVRCVPPSIPALLAWGVQHAAEVVSACSPATLEYVHSQVLPAAQSMAGIGSPPVTLGKLIQNLQGVNSVDEVYVSTRKASSLLRALGTPTSRRTVQRWAQRGKVRQQLDDNGFVSGFSLADILKQVELDKPSATSAGKMDTEAQQCDSGREIA